MQADCEDVDEDDGEPEVRDRDAELRCAHDAATDTLSGRYSEEEFFDDLLRVTQGNTDEALARHMIHESKDVLDWMPQQGVRFQPSLGGTLSLGVKAQHEVVGVAGIGTGTPNAGLGT